MFRAIIPFKLIFVYMWGMDWGSFFSPIWVVNFYITIFNNFLFHIDLFWQLCWKQIYQVNPGIFLDSLFCSVDCFVLSLDQYHSLLINVVYSSILNYDSVIAHLFLPFKYKFDYYLKLIIHLNFWISLLIFIKEKSAKTLTELYYNFKTICRELAS